MLQGTAAIAIVRAHNGTALLPQLCCLAILAEFNTKGPLSPLPSLETGKCQLPCLADPMKHQGMLNSANPALAEIVPSCIAYENRIVAIADWQGLLIFGSDTSITDADKTRLSTILGRRVRVLYRSAAWVDANLQKAYETTREYNTTAFGDVTFYWPEGHRFDAEGMLTIPCSIWQGATTHCSGAAQYSRSHEDYGFWSWVVRIPQYHRLVADSELPAIRRIWRRYLERRGR